MQFRELSVHNTCTPFLSRFSVKNCTVISNCTDNRKQAHKQFECGNLLSTHLFAIGLGSCCNTQSSTGPRHSGSILLTACHPPQGTLTPGLAYKSHTHAACVFLADLHHSSYQQHTYCIKHTTSILIQSVQIF